MREIEFVIEDWIGTCESSDAGLATLASLRIQVGFGSDPIPLTEVDDTIARTVRQHINVPVHRLARWLLVNWWRLRWEPQRTTPEWRLAHSMASIGEGYAWPPVEFSSDGEFIQIHLEAESKPDVAAIRYLRDVRMDIPAVHFEDAVDQLVRLVQERLSACRHADRDLEDLRIELAEERSDPELSRACRLQAHAGIDPGAAPAGWLDEAMELSETTGRTAIDEVMAVLPELGGDFESARREIEGIRDSAQTVDLSWVETGQANSGRELPWQKGTRLAREFRQRFGPAHGRITNGELGDRLGVKLPLQALPRQPLGGGYRNGATKGRTALVVPTPRPDSQRFYLARLIGCALLSSAEEHLLPVTAAATAMQKCERSFAQEFLCPWMELDEFTDRKGLDDEGIADAAEHFQVSERLVLTTLVNKKKLPRDRLWMT